MRLTKTIKEAIHAHAKICYPAECCGLIIDGQYYPCDNVTPNPTEHFEIDPIDMFEMGKRVKYKRLSIATLTAMLSRPKWIGCKWSIHGLDWVICALVTTLMAKSTLMSNAISPKRIKPHY